MTETDRLCFHCGEPVPYSCNLTIEADEQMEPVCCSGCQAVANLILQSGQARYYQFRTETALKPADEDAAIVDSWKRYDERESLWGSPLKDGCYELLLQVEGIRCAACAWLIRSQLEARPGIDQVQVDVATGFVRINWHPDQLQLSRIAAILSAASRRVVLLAPLSTRSANRASFVIFAMAASAGFFPQFCLTTLANRC